MVHISISTIILAVLAFSVYPTFAAPIDTTGRALSVRETVPDTALPDAAPGTAAALQDPVTGATHRDAGTSATPPNAAAGFSLQDAATAGATTPNAETGATPPVGALTDPSPNPADSKSVEGHHCHHHHHHRERADGRKRHHCHHHHHNKHKEDDDKQSESRLGGSAATNYVTPFDRDAGAAGVASQPVTRAIDDLEDDDPDDPDSEDDEPEDNERRREIRDLSAKSHRLHNAKSLSRKATQILHRPRDLEGDFWQGFARDYDEDLRWS